MRAHYSAPVQSDAGDLQAGPTVSVFTSPREKLTEDYVTGRFG
jgi:ABC-type phosphate transport system ATPase subunit